MPEPDAVCTDSPDFRSGDSDPCSQVSGLGFRDPGFGYEPAGR